MKERTVSPWLILAVTSLGVFMSALDITIVNVAFPDIRKTFHGSSAASLSWVLNAYTIAFGALLIASGRIADRFGRRRVFFTGLGVFTAGSALCGIAPTLPALVAGRLVQGTGAALIIPASLGLLLAGFPAERRAFAVALWGSVSAFASALGPSLGALIIEGPGWRWAFLLNLPVGAVAFIVGRKLLRESKDEASRGIPDPVGVGLVSLAMGALALAIVEGPEWGWTDSRVIAAFVAVAAMIPALVFRSGRHPVPAVELSLFRVRSFAVANVVMLFYAAAFFSTLLGSILYLTTVWHYSVLRAGLAFTPGPLTVVVVSAVAGRLVSRVGFRPLIALGSTLGAVALMRFATQTGTEPDYLRVWLPSNILLGMGVGLSFAIISAAAVSGLAPSRFGVASGINQTARQVGGVIGVAVLIAIVGTPATREIAMDRLHIVFATSAVLMVGAGITSLALGGRRVAVAPEVPAGRAVTAAPATPGWMPE